MAGITADNKFKNGLGQEARTIPFKPALKLFTLEATAPKRFVEMYSFDTFKYVCHCKGNRSFRNYYLQTTIYELIANALRFFLEVLK